MRSGCHIYIDRLQNGYTLRITDPEIVERNNNRARDGPVDNQWQDPEVKYVFEKSDEVIEFLKKNIEKALPKDEYSSSFDQAVKEVTNE